MLSGWGARTSASPRDSRNRRPRADTGATALNQQYRLAALISHPIQYFAPLYRRLAREPDIDLTVYYSSHRGVEPYLDPGFGQRFRWDVSLLDGYRHRFLPNAGQGEAGFASLVNPAIVPELTRNRFDALWIHGHNHATNLLALAAARLVGTRVMMRGETHLGLKRPGWKLRLRRPLMTALYRLCDACLPIGTRNADFYRYHGVGEGKLFMVPYTVDNDFFTTSVERYRQNMARVREELGIRPNRPVILFASKLIPRKRPFDLLRAYHAITVQGVEATLLFVGSGEEEPRLRRYVQDHQLADVLFPGFQNQTELPRFYALADLFVLPSEDEPWGLVINEVMCAGLPVIATREIGAVADLVRHGHNGLLYDTGDVDTLSAHLHALVKDADLRARMGANSRAIIDGWGLDQSVAGIRAALARLKGRIE